MRSGLGRPLHRARRRPMELRGPSARSADPGLERTSGGVARAHRYDRSFVHDRGPPHEPDLLARRGRSIRCHGAGGGPYHLSAQRRPLARLLAGHVLHLRVEERQDTLRITAPDTLGNIGQSNVVWTVDVGPPRIRLARAPDRSTSLPVADFRLWSKADPALFLRSFDGSPVMPCDDKNTFGPLPEGPHRLRVWGLDAAMNRTAPLTFRWEVDTIPPGLLLTGIPEEGAITTETTASFDIWQASPAPCSAPSTTRSSRPARHRPCISGSSMGRTRSACTCSIGRATSRSRPLGPGRSIPSPEPSRACQTRCLSWRHGKRHLTRGIPDLARAARSGHGRRPP